MPCLKCLQVNEKVSISGLYFLLHMTNSKMSFLSEHPVENMACFIPNQSKHWCANVYKIVKIPKGGVFYTINGRLMAKSFKVVLHGEVGHRTKKSLKRP